MTVRERSLSERVRVARERAYRAAPYAALGWSLFLIARSNWLALRPSPAWLNPDEGYIAALAMRMIAGHWLPYVDGVSHRGPMLYYVAAVWLRVFGVSLEAVRALAFSMSALVAILVFAIGLLARRPFLGAVAALVWALTTVGWLQPATDGMALNGEVVADVFILASFACLTSTLRAGAPIRRGLLFSAGALCALGMLSKQTMSIALVPFSLWVLSAALGRTEYAKTIRTQWVLAFAAGFAAPLAIVLCRYAFAGALETFFYYFFEYNRDVYMAPLRGVLGLELFEFWFAQNLPLIAVAAALAFGLITSAALADKRAKYLDRNGFAVTIALTTFAVGVTCNATLRGFGHYFLQLFPWAGLLIGYVLECVVLPEGLLGLPSFIMLTVWAAAADWGWSYQFNSNAFRSLRAQVTDPSATELCSYLHEHTRPYDPVFIWGFYAEPYVSCRVTPATRYVYTTFPAGVVPWFESSLEVENQRAVPGSRALLLQDLETTKPPVIVDFAASLMNRSMTRYRELADYLERHYCPDEHLANGDVYLRKQKGQSCP